MMLCSRSSPKRRGHVLAMHCTFALFAHFALFAPYALSPGRSPTVLPRANPTRCSVFPDVTPHLLACDFQADHSGSLAFRWDGCNSIPERFQLSKGRSTRTATQTIPGWSCRSRLCSGKLTHLQAVTLAVAKRLVKEAKEQSGREEKIRWRDVTLVMEAGAIAEVDAQLSKEGIDQVDKTAIRVRLKKAMRDVQRSESTPLVSMTCD